MKIHSVTRYASTRRADTATRPLPRLSPPGVEVVLEDGGPEVPRQFATRDDIETSTSAVTKALTQASAEDYTLRMPDCVLDPAVPVTPDGSTVPTVGMLRLTAGHLAATGTVFGAVTRNRAIGDALAERIEEYGLGPWFAGGPSSTSTSTPSRHPAMERGRTPRARRIRRPRRDRRDQRLLRRRHGHPHPVRLVDPAERALRLLAAGVRA